MTSSYVPLQTVLPELETYRLGVSIALLTLFSRSCSLCRICTLCDRMPQMDIFKEYQEAGYEPDEMCFNTVICAFARCVTGPMEMCNAILPQIHERTLHEWSRAHG